MRELCTLGGTCRIPIRLIRHNKEIRVDLCFLSTFRYKWSHDLPCNVTTCFSLPPPLPSPLARCYLVSLPGLVIPTSLWMIPRASPIGSAICPEICAPCPIHHRTDPSYILSNTITRIEAHLMFTPRTRLCFMADAPTALTQK